MDIYLVVGYILLAFLVFNAICDVIEYAMGSINIKQELTGLFLLTVYYMIIISWVWVAIKKA